MLGKRKRPSATISTKPRGRKTAPPITDNVDSESESEQALQRILQRHFEARFAPLPEAVKAHEPPATTSQEDDSAPEGDSDWDGLDDEVDTENGGVQVVEVHVPDRALGLDKEEAKAFMVGTLRPVIGSFVLSSLQNSKPPSSDRKAPATSKGKTEDAEDSKSEKLNLKNDLELHRLIAESHLLDSSKSASANHRQKILDMRMQALGSKKSLLKQENMPMTHRKGIIAKSKDREVKRRKDAKDNGVILEKEVREARQTKKRTRGVTGPSVGKFAGGMLKLSKRDVASITGPKKARRR